MGTSAVDQIVTDATGLVNPTPSISVPVPSRSRQDIIADLTAGRTPTLANAAQGAVAEVANDQPRVVIKSPNTDAEGNRIPDAPSLEDHTRLELGETIEAEADDPGLAPKPIAAPAPEQKKLEAGLDVGTGDALFRVRNKDGTFANVPEQTIELAIRDKDTGEIKTYTKTLPELARMARDGVAGQKTVAEVQHYRDMLPKWKEAALARESELQQALEQQFALNRELLTADDEIVIQRREQYAAETSPEKRLARMQAERAEQERAQHDERARAQQSQEIMGFYNTRVQPVVGKVMEVLPPELVLGRMNIDTASLMRGGVIPREHWQAFEAYIRGPFIAWANKEAAARHGAASQAKASEIAAADAQKAAQRAKNEIGKKLQPVGAAAADTPKKLPPPKNKREALDRMLARPMQG